MQTPKVSNVDARDSVKSWIRGSLYPISQRKPFPLGEG